MTDSTLQSPLNVSKQATQNGTQNAGSSVAASSVLPNSTKNLVKPWNGISGWKAGVGEPEEHLSIRIKDKSAQVVVIGMGYVGLPLSMCAAQESYSVLGLDVDPMRVSKINAGQSGILQSMDAELATHVRNEKISASNDFQHLQDADIIIICVPTPLTKNHTPDTSYIEQSTREIVKHLHRGQLVILESTTYPGTTEEIVLPILEETGLKAGKDFFLAFSPERVDPGNAVFNIANTNKVVGGLTPACRRLADAFYNQIIVDIISVSSPACAEMVKVFENTFRAVNIALVNEFAMLCDKMNLNVWEVMEAAATKPFGLMPFSPGPGVGGHCIPIDPFYLSWKAREYDFQTRFIELAGEINTGMPYFVREKIIRALGRVGKPLYQSKVLILGMAYKSDISDWRHSPGLDLLHILKNDEVNVVYNDPYVPDLEDEDGKPYFSLNMSAETLREADCVVLITNHSDYDLDFIVENSKIMVDTRNATKALSNKALLEKVILL